MNLIRLRVVTAFNVYRVGQIIERMPGVARQMLAASWYGRKLVEEVPVVAPVIEPLLVADELPRNEPEPRPIEAGATQYERKHKHKRGNP